MDNEQNVIAYYERHSVHNQFALYTKIWTFAISLLDNMMCTSQRYLFFSSSVPSLVGDIQESILTTAAYY